MGACRQHLQQVTRRLRGYEPPPGSSEKAIEAEWVAVYGGGAQAVRAGNIAAARLRIGQATLRLLVVQRAEAGR